MDVIKFERLQDETDEELIYRICSQKDIIGTWSDVASIINQLTGNDFGESTYRKKFQSFQKMLNANQSKFTDSDEQLKELEFQKRELNKAKVKLQTEKLEYNRWLRDLWIFPLILNQNITLVVSPLCMAMNILALNMS